jgi:hypothetical protein
MSRKKFSFLLMSNNDFWSSVVTREPKTIHTRHPSYTPSKQNIPTSSARFFLLYSLLLHPPSFIPLLYLNNQAHTKYYSPISPSLLPPRFLHRTLLPRPSRSTALPPSPPRRVGRWWQATPARAPPLPSPASWVHEEEQRLAVPELVSLGEISPLTRGGIEWGSGRRS